MSESGSGKCACSDFSSRWTKLRLRRLPVTARQLADEMGVSIRTIYRDIADLQSMGAPIRGEGGVGYVMEPGLFMPSLRFDDTEMEALALGAKLVAARSDRRLAEAARSATTKIASALGDTSSEILTYSNIEAAPSEPATTPHLAALRSAVKRQALLDIEYLSLSGARSQRRARPLGLTVFDAVWLLTIWCERASDFRHLRLDRIEGISDTGLTFRPERGKRFEDCLLMEDGSRLRLASRPPQPGTREKMPVLQKHRHSGGPGSGR